jgi:hypothetical protein
MSNRPSVRKNAYFHPMLFLRGKRLICLLIPLLLLIHSCNLDGSDNNGLEGATEEDSSKTNNKNEVLWFYEIRDIAIAYEGAIRVYSDVGYWGYESGYQWVSGEKYRQSDMFDFSIKKAVNGIFIGLVFDLETLQPFPIVHDYKFNDKDEADYLHVELILRNNQNSRKVKITDNINLSTDGTGTFETVLKLEDFKDLPPGVMEYTLEIKTTLTTFFDIRSKVKPISAKVSFLYEVPQMYKTVLSFKSLKLNEEETRKVLGDNDFGNGTPETGIQVMYNGNSVLYEYTKNSYNYMKKHKVNVYHLSPTDFVTIRALDVDYGFNGNDIINDTILSLKSLEGTDYFNLKMKCVDELLLFTQYKGKAN